MEFKKRRKEALKILISADGPDLKAEVGDRFGSSQYLLIVDPATMSFETMPNPGVSNHGFSGMQTVVLAISKSVDLVLTGYMSPVAMKYLLKNGIEVQTGIQGTIAEVMDRYTKGYLKKSKKDDSVSIKTEIRVERSDIIRALRSSATQFRNMIPILAGVVLLIGLLSVFVSKELLSNIFSGKIALDTFFGACLGSVFAGNPINSYVIGGELLKHNASLYAVTAFMVAWVNVGLIQLPAEALAIGRKFALLRNALAFVISIVVAILTVTVLNLFKG